MLKLKLPYKRQKDGTYNVFISGKEFVLQHNWKDISRYDFRRHGIIPGDFTLSKVLIEQFFVYTEPKEDGTYWIRHGRYNGTGKLQTYEFYMTEADIMNLGGMCKTFERMMKEDA